MLAHTQNLTPGTYKALGSGCLPRSSAHRGQVRPPAAEGQWGAGLGLKKGLGCTRLECKLTISLKALGVRFLGLWCPEVHLLGAWMRVYSLQ